MPPSPPAKLLITPRAKKLAADMLVGPAAIRGTGPDGRVTEADVKQFIAEKGIEAIKVTPVARELMNKHALTVLDVCPSGEGGRITQEDVERAVAEKPRPMSKMRRIIAQRMAQSMQTIPHFYVTVRVDMTDLMAFRKEARREHGLKASVGDFIGKAVALTLREMPVVNSVCLGDTVKTHREVNIGMAVALEEGLVVPVIRNADALSLDQIAEKSKDLSARAREKKLAPEEYQGGTFTISNMGMLGVSHFTAIINPGEGAILAVGAAEETGVVRKGELAVRTLMNMTLSSDHRIIDGAVAAQFLKRLKEKLEDVELWRRMV